MKKYLIVLSILFYSTLCKAQPKAYIVKVETNNQIENSSYHIPTSNNDIDLSYISNRIDSFLLSGYFDGFPFNITEKNVVVDNSNYNGYNSEVFSNIVNNVYYGGLSNNVEVDNFISQGDGYIPNETYIFLSENKDSQAFSEFFPEADVFIGAIIEFHVTAYTSETSTRTITARIEMRFNLPDNKKIFRYSRSTMLSLPPSEVDFFNSSSLDELAEKNSLNKAISKLIQKMEEKKFNDIKKTSKWFAKKYE